MTKITPAQLAGAVSKLMQTIEARTPNPILGFIHMEAQGDALELIATDLDIRLTTTIPCLGTFSPICVDAGRLSAALGRIKDRGEAVLEPINGNAPTMRVTSGRSEFNLPTLSADGFPKLFVPTDAISFTLEGAIFRKILAAQQVSVSQEETRFYLCGVAMQPGDLHSGNTPGRLVFVSTDGHKGMARHMDVPDLPPSLQPVIIPTKTTAVIAKIFDKASFLSMEVGKDRIRVTADGLEMISKLIEGTFPDWRRVMPAKEPTLGYDAKAFAASIETAGAVTGTLSKQGKAVKMVFSEGETELSTIDHDNPNFTGRDVCRHEDLGPTDQSQVGANYKYMVEMINALDVETVNMALSGENGPIILTGEGHDDRRAVIMPMRV